MKKEDVNKKHTTTWEKLNNNSKSHKWRKIFLDHFGGEFKKQGRCVEWEGVCANRGASDTHYFYNKS